MDKQLCKIRAGGMVLKRALSGCRSHAGRESKQFGIHRLDMLIVIAGREQLQNLADFVKGVNCWEYA